MKDNTSEPIKVHKYDHTDIRPREGAADDLPKHRFMFLADVAGDNSELFGLQDDYVDNHYIARHLKELGAVGAGVVLDEESCMFYAYFTTQHAGTEFLQKLSAWLVQKARLIEKAKAY